MNKRVLLPTDYSKNAINAIRYAQELYQDIECDFYLLNTFQVSGYRLDSMRIPEPGEYFYETAKTKSEEGMSRLMEMIRSHSENTKHHFHTICTLNSLVEAIKNLIVQKDIDIIVMGTKGTTASKARIFGTNTVTVMEQIRECPVIAVPENPAFSPPKEIVFPTDYKTNYKKREMTHLVEIAKMHNAKINVIHIVKDKNGKLSKKGRANQRLLQDILNGTNYKMHFLSATKISKGITQYIEERNCDMIAFMNRKHLFFGSILSNPLVKEIGYEPKTPILELNDN